MSILGCSLFTAFTGATGVTIVALGALLLPALLEDKYRENFSLGLVTMGGSLGLLFAPSVPLIIYGVITETPIGDMFIAGALPGVIMLIILMSGMVGLPSFSCRCRRRSRRGCCWASPILRRSS